jgi:tetratricopeptide (TPR) repeat protein
LPFGAAVFLGLLWLARRDAVRGIGLAIFLVPLAPAFNINAFAPDRIVADRYLYLPLLGLLMILVPSCAEMVSALRGRLTGAHPDLATFWVFAAAAALLGLQTIRYNRTWQSELTLWTAAVAADPNSVSALNEYGLLMFNAKNYAEARRVLDRALSLTPLTTAFLLRADVATAENRFADAEADVKTVLASYPDNAGAYERLALAYQKQNRLAEAEQLLRTAIVQAPHRKGTFTDSLGVVLYLQGRRDDALKVLEDGRAVARTDLDPGAQGIFFHLGMLYQETGRTHEAREALEEYLRLTERSVEAAHDTRRQQAAATLEQLPR